MIEPKRNKYYNSLNNINEIVVVYYFLLPTYAKEIYLFYLFSNFRNVDFDGLARFEAL